RRASARPSRSPGCASCPCSSKVWRRCFRRRKSAESSMGKGALGQLAAYWPEDTARYAHVPLKRVGEITLHAPTAAAADRAALVTPVGVATYAQISDRVRRLAASLRGRLQRGSRVAVGLAEPLDLVTAL